VLPPKKAEVLRGFFRSQANVETVDIFKRAATTLFQILTLSLTNIFTF